MGFQHSDGVTLLSRRNVSNTLNLKECLTLLDLGGAASGITEGEDETGSKQEPSVVYWFMQSNLLLVT